MKHYNDNSGPMRWQGGCPSPQGNHYPIKYVTYKEEKVNLCLEIDTVIIKKGQQKLQRNDMVQQRNEEATKGEEAKKRGAT